MNAPGSPPGGAPPLPRRLPGTAPPTPRKAPRDLPRAARTRRHVALRSAIYSARPMRTDAPLARRHGLEDRQPFWPWNPARAVAVEDRHGRVEQGRVVQAAGVDRVGVVDADDTPEHQAAAGRAEVAHRFAAPERGAPELPGFAADAHGGGGEADERDET